MKSCLFCRQSAAWSWQPTLGDARSGFYRPGHHVRGYTVLPVCDICREQIARGDPIEFARRGVTWWIQPGPGGNILVNSSMLPHP